MRFAPLAILFLLVTSPAAFAQRQWGRPRPPGAGACFYRDINFQGDFFCMKDGERWPALPHGFNDVISSIRVFGGVRLRIFYDNNFRGASLLIDRDTNDLRQFPVGGNTRGNWNDRVSAIALFRDRDQWEPRRDGR